MYRIVALVGLSGSGKTTLAQAACERLSVLREVMSFTTRPPTGNESRDRTYRFYTASTVTELARHGEIVNVVGYDGHAYGNIWDDLKAVDQAGKIGILAMTEEGVKNFLAHTEIDLFVIRVVALGAPVRTGREKADAEREPLARCDATLINLHQIGGFEAAVDDLVNLIKRRFNVS